MIMNFLDIFKYCKGIIDEDFNYKPINQIKIKDIFKYDFYIIIFKNKVFFIPFENLDANDYKMSNENYENDDNIKFSEFICNIIYSTQIYKIIFTPLTFSKDCDEKIFPEYDENFKINLYSRKNIPIKFFKLYENNIFINLKIISHILYREELNDYINSLEVEKNKKNSF